ncbi:nucleoside phosphorylase domain-containing protein [Aspergillus spectabilis]
MAPRSRNDFEVAIICALPVEADAVETLFNHRGDPVAYLTGMIGEHNVVLVYMPGMGKSHGAAVAAYCRSSFPDIRLALVVGICGGAPSASDGKQIHLGDVVISSGLVQYDFGWRHTDGFLRKDPVLDNLGRPSLEIRALLAKLQGRRSRIRLRDRLNEHFFNRVRASGLGVWASPRRQSTSRPNVHVELVVSGDQGVIAFEMESARVWNTFPCLVIKGVADYADCHKNKLWQDYAAATAAACAKVFLELWT